MIIDFKTRLEKRIYKLQELYDKTTELLKEAPNGRVYVKHRKDNCYYYLAGGDFNAKERLLGKNDTELRDRLLQKGYWEQVLNATKNELKVLKNFRKQYPVLVVEDVYDHIKIDRKPYIRPIILTDEQYISEWQNRPYDKKPISDDIPIFKTLRGERVRSKSEVIIADRLYANGIPYKYECPILVGDEIMHPDFTILRVSDRKVVYLEHCGKVGDPDYADDMTERINKYTLAGIYHRDRLFFTFETANKPLDVRVLDKMINDIFK
ncbi:MAG: hypothetical protein IKS75_00665 [Clostridiales bacterium]|nr:hypothetical protein [Clostridiales bacterium]